MAGGGLTNQAAPQQADQDRGLKDVAVECARQHDEEELPLCHGALRRMSVMARFAELGLVTLPGWVGVREPRGRLGDDTRKKLPFTICPTQGQACTTPHGKSPGAFLVSRNGGLFRDWRVAILVVICRYKHTITAVSRKR